MRDKLVATGVPADRVTIRPTWVPDPGAAGAPGRDVLYVGRLDEAKGIDRLLDAWARGRPEGRRLVVAGDGPMASLVDDARQQDPSIEWLGAVSSERVAEAMRDAAYVVVPSRFFEGYPLVVAEAFGRGRAVLTVSGGSVGTIVTEETGWVVDPTVEALSTSIRAITDDEAAQRGFAARAAYDRTTAR